MLYLCSRFVKGQLCKIQPFPRNPLITEDIQTSKSMAEPETNLSTIANMTGMEPNETQRPPRVKVPLLRRFSNPVNPSVSLGKIVELAAEEDHDSPPEQAAVPPSERLLTLIQADRSPPGQRTLFAAIDALRPELSYQDSITGLQTALNLLRETLEDALENPSVIQGRRHVRDKLEAEYFALPDEKVLNGIIMDALIHGIKERISSRWRIEAMAARQLKGIV